MSAGINAMADCGAVFFVRRATVRFGSQIIKSAVRCTLKNTGNRTVCGTTSRITRQKWGRASASMSRTIMCADQDFTLDTACGREYSFDLIEYTAKKSIVVE